MFRLVALAVLVSLSACKKDDKKSDAPAADKGEDKAGANRPADETPDTPTDEAPANKAPGGTCPEGTTLTSLVSYKDISAQGPYDLATFTKAKAKWKDDKSVLDIMVTNKDWSAKEMIGLPIPIKENGEAIVKISLHGAGKPVELGTIPHRDHSKEEEVPYASLSLFVKDLSIGNTLYDSKVELTGIFDDKVCGSFSLKSEHAFENGTTTDIAGTFVASFDAE